MSITGEDTRIVFVGDGNDNSPYAISFHLRDDDSVEVIYITDADGTEVVKTKTTDYTIAIANDFASASLTLVTTAPASGETMLVRRNEPGTRLSNYKLGDGQPAAVSNSDFDKRTMHEQTLQEQLDRTIVVAKGHPDADLPLDPLNLIGAAAKIVTVKSDESGFELLANGISDGTIAPAKLLDGTVDNQIIQFDLGGGEWEYRTLLTINSDEDGTTILGRAKIGSIAGDDLAIAHFDHFTAAGKMVAQDSVGDTVLNSAAGRILKLTIGGVSQFSITTVACTLPTINFVLTAGGLTLTAGSVVVGGIITAGSGSTVLTTAAGLLRHQAIDPAIAGTGLSVASGVLSATAGALSGSGTDGTIPLWTPDGDTLGDSALTQSGSAISTTLNFLSTSNDLAVINTAIGSIVQLRVSNTDNTNGASHAQLRITTGGVSGGDPYVQWAGGAESYVLGIDNSDSDKLVGSVGAVLGTTNWLEVTTARGITLDAASGQTISLQVNSTEEVQVSGTAVTLATNNLVLTAGNLQVTAGQAAIGRAILAGVQLVVQRTDALTTDIVRITQGSTGDCTLAFVLISGSNWMMGTDNDDGDSFKLGNAIGDLGSSPKLVITTSGDISVPNGNLDINGFLILPKASTSGIKVDRTTPTFGFADIIGDRFSDNTGATKPTKATYNGAVKSWQFAADDEAFMSFHIPHDYVKGTDIFLHIHWSHTGTLVTGGTVTFKASSLYSKSHNQAAFPSVGAVGTFVGSASTTRYQQILTEVQYSDTTPTGIELDTNLLEPDGVIEMTFEVDVNGITVSGGGVPDPFIHFVDIHYQTMGFKGTKDKAPDFYT